MYILAQMATGIYTEDNFDTLLQDFMWQILSELLMLSKRKLYML